MNVDCARARLWHSFRVDYCVDVEYVPQIYIHVNAVVSAFVVVISFGYFLKFVEYFSYEL